MFVVSKSKGIKMKKKIALACLCGAAILASQGAMASGIKVRGGATNNDYTLDVTPATGSAYTYAKSSFSGKNLGLTWLMDDSTYLDFALSNGSGNWDGTYTNGTGFSSTMTRDDSAIILGSTSVTSGGSATNLYFGWKTGETKLDRAPQTITLANPYNTNSSLSFKTSGLVFGGGLGIPAGGGTVGLSLGMGIMSGQYDTTRNTSTTTATTTPNKADMAFGFSYGIGYTYSFTPNFGVSVDYKGNIYNYTFNVGQTGTNGEWSLNEKFNTTGVSAYLKF
ncbi:MAG: hypothetical protein WCI39_01175 [Gallionellaceae bacterium]